MLALRTTTVLILALLLSACVSLPSPIGASVGFKNDPALQGLWYGKADKDSDPAYYHVLLNAGDTVTVVGVGASNDDTGGWGVLMVTTVPLGGNRFINAREIFEDGRPKSDPENPAAWYSGLYRLEDNVLTIYAFDENKVAAEVKAGRIAGTVSQGRFGDSVSITADAAHVDKWLSSPGAASLFVPLFRMYRVKEPALPAR